MNNFEIHNPWLLFVALPLLIVVVVGYLLLPKQKKRRPKNIASLAIHCVICITLALAFADIRYVEDKSNVELYMVVDCSASEEKNVEKIDTIINDVKDKASDKTKVGVVCFAKNSEVLVKPGAKIKSVAEMFDEKKHSDFDNDASDIKSALLYTNELYSDNVVRRMILVTDGMETDNKAVEAVDQLLSNDVYLDCISLTTNIGDEVAITGIEYTDHCYVNRQQVVKASVHSTREQNITLNLTSNGSLIESKEVNVNRGLNIVSFDTPSDKVGTFDYQISIAGKHDSYEENNSKGFTQDFTDKFNILFVGKTQEELNNFKAMNLYTENTVIDSKIDKANLPATLDELIKYDEIILSDTNLAQVNNGEEFIANLNTAVNLYGKSVLTFGGTYSGKSNLEYIHSYNDMLPIQFESNEGRAIVFLIDVSGSMSTDDRLGKAKSGAIRCLDVLTDKDYVSIVTFSDDVKIVQPLTSIKNKAQIAAKIRRISSEGGTTMGPGLEEAYKQVKTSSLESRTVITLSDGQPFDSDSSLKRRVISYAAQGIVFSFINISNNYSDSISLLKSLSAFGNGNYYYVRSASGLVSTMVNSVLSDIQETVIEEKTAITIRQADDPVMTGVTGQLSDLEAYNFCRLKSGATTVLTAQYKKTVDDTVKTATVPIYAYWDLGKGKVASFSSSLAGNASKALRECSAGKLLFKNIGVQTLPDRNMVSILDMTYVNNGKTSQVSVGTNNGDNTAKVSIKVTSPAGEEKDYELYFDGAKYTTTVETGATGKYNVHISYQPAKTDSKGNVTYEEKESLDLPLYFDYSKEYDVFTEENNDTLYNVSTLANGSLTVDKAKLSSLDKIIAFKSVKSSMIFFLLLSVILFLVDVFIRKSDFKPKKKAVAQ